jgi:predicted nucleotidyltransferase component of viral defense system
MITRKELVAIARKTGLNLYQQEKEYLLKLFLHYYYSKYEDAVFKGGTAIRFTKGLGRFSEDLDFNIVVAPEKFLEQMNHVLNEIKKIGINCSFLKKEMFNDAVTAEIEFHGPLFDGTNQTRNKIRIDAGKRLRTIADPKWMLIESEYPEIKERFLVKTMDEKEMLAEKIIAMFDREKGRDLYDAWFLLGVGVTVDNTLLVKKLGKVKLKMERFVKESEYERDIKYLVARYIPYKQVKEEVLKAIEEKHINN